ncbi:MAG: Crp/Fnr family transcriptional regulator [Bdellovibrionales bacterium]|nr:Crp/Fnr family transcriptional regulator [Bdellovibrionales bacterium]
MPVKKPTGTTSGAAPIGAGEAGPRVIQLQKGELLFAEGESSRSMYFLKTGIIRIFKKKGNASIEVATINSGQVLGELAFLDGAPRSASAEGLTTCTLVEVSGVTFTQTLSKLPDWLKLLLKTIVGRLRSSSTRIRQLEQASTAFDYSSKDGKRSAHYVYLSPHDTLKIAAALLLVGTRNGEQKGKGRTVRAGLLQRYANQIMGVPVAKITTLLDVFQSCGILEGVDQAGSNEVMLVDPDFLEIYIAYQNEENLVEPSKQHNVSIKGFLIMSLIAKYIHQYPANEATGVSRVNLAEIIQAEAQLTGKEPFRMDEFPEVVNLGYCTQIEVKSSAQVFTQVKPQEFLKHYRLQRVSKALQAVNEEKSRV